MPREFKTSKQTNDISELIDKYRKQKVESYEQWEAEEMQNEHCTQYQEQCRTEMCTYQDMITDLEVLLNKQIDCDRLNYIKDELVNYENGFRALQSINELGDDFELFRNNEGIDTLYKWKRIERRVELETIIETLKNIIKLFDGNMLETLYRVYHMYEYNEERVSYKKHYIYGLNSRIFNIESSLIHDKEFKEYFLKLEDEYRKLNPNSYIRCTYPQLHIKDKNEDTEVKKFNNIFKYDNGKVLDKHRTDCGDGERTYRAKEILQDKHLYSDGWEYTLKKFRYERCWVTGKRVFQIYIHTIKQSKFKGNTFYMDITKGGFKCLNNVRKIQGQSIRQDYLTYKGKILPVAIGG